MGLVSADHVPFSIYEDIARPTRDIIHVSHFTIVIEEIENLYPRHPVLTNEFRNFPSILIIADSDNHKVLCELLMKRKQIRCVLDTWPAPCVPEVEEDVLTSMRRQRDGRTIQCHGRKVRGR